MPRFRTVRLTVAFSHASCSLVAAMTPIRVSTTRAATEMVARLAAEHGPLLSCHTRSRLLTDDQWRARGGDSADLPSASNAIVCV